MSYDMVITIFFVVNEEWPDGTARLQTCYKYIFTEYGLRACAATRSKAAAGGLEKGRLLFWDRQFFFSPRKTKRVQEWGRSWPGFWLIYVFIYTRYTNCSREQRARNGFRIQMTGIKLSARARRCCFAILSLAGTINPYCCPRETGVPSTPCYCVRVFFSRDVLSEQEKSHD